VGVPVSLMVKCGVGMGVGVLGVGVGVPICSMGKGVVSSPGHVSTPKAGELIDRVIGEESGSKVTDGLIGSLDGGLSASALCRSTSAF